MITMFKWIRLQDLEFQKDQLEKKILSQRKKIDIYDLRELESIYAEIVLLRGNYIDE